jgi:hypothetical protein
VSYTDLVLVSAAVSALVSVVATLITLAVQRRWGLGKVPGAVSAAGQTSKSEELRGWLSVAVQIIAVIIGGIWVAFTFYYSENLKPYRQKTFIQATVDMRIVDTVRLRNGSEVHVIEVKVAGENRGPRRTKIGAGYLTVHADKIAQSPKGDFSPAALEKSLNKDKGSRTRHYGPAERTELVYVASVFYGDDEDWWLESGERQEFRRVFRVPKNLYDQLEANVAILSGESADKVTIRLRVNDKEEIMYGLTEKNDPGHIEHLDQPGKPLRLLNTYVSEANSTTFLALPVARRK